ncbi:glycosyltransferase [Geotalea uraniireducens]|uniref:Glycosyl transferase, group 1 n=1 Tax=Geotalea uraniireducens (strain Rf4) TaxID=351605 RepID=A5GEM8_GEOUR|nr:glycosyltransferase [Geotalea uraniireducens]ABQ25883.1 glycosyl transferase, group 1 [Geotalea uraniireducens Rf4]
MKSNILHILPSFGPKSFGIGPVALNLLREQRELGFDARIWCLDLDNEADLRWDVFSRELPDTSIQIFPRSWPTLFRYSLAMERAVSSDTGRNISIVHQHGIWSGISRTTNIMRQRYGTPTIVAPHGSIEGWALNKSWWKKRLALAFYERKNLQSASCLHACSHQEVAGFREFGLSNPVAVIPNGISMSWLKSEGNGIAFRRQFGIPESKRILLYLSRITPVKGLPMLIQAIGSMKQQMTDWVLVLAGADEFGHLKEIQQAVLNADLQHSVMFTGMLMGQIKRDAFSAADLLVLPTFRENFGIVVAEALGAGVPVITTNGAPWEDLVTHGCGWWTEISADALAVALKAAFSKTSKELKTMGERGRELVSTRYTWTISAQMTIELYEWLLGHKEKPMFLVTD